MKKLHIGGAAAALALLAAPTVATGQQTRWYLAEGSTGPFFEEEVLRSTRPIRRRRASSASTATAPPSTSRSRSRRAAG